MKPNAMRVRHAAKDLDAARQYLGLAAMAIDRAALVLADEQRHDPALRREREQAELLRGLADRAAEGATCIDIGELRAYTPPTPTPEACHG